MAQLAAPQQKGMGPGFWPVTAVLTIVNAIVSYFIVIFPIDQYLPEAAAPAGDIDLLFKFMSVVGNAIFVYVTGYLLYFCWVWRRRASDEPDAIGIQVHDSPTLELWWTIVPADPRHHGRGLFGAHLVQSSEHARRRADDGIDRPSVQVRVPLPAARSSRSTTTCTFRSGRP